MALAGTRKTLSWPRLRPGDRVRLISPASYPTRDWVDESAKILSSWELDVEIGEHTPAVSK